METPVISVQSEETHKLSDQWTLWAHLPHNTDWSIKSYIKMFTFKTVEEIIAITETLPNILVENCMLFMMRDGISPIWEDPKNRNGGCFSYKITNKTVHKAWKELSYVVAGNTLSKKPNFVDHVTGITISPKKSFCIIKIWMSDCSNKDPDVITEELTCLNSHGCLFKKHAPEF
jgi:hypothetical protein